jgi:adenosylcobinamide-phosphate synthase
VTFFSILLALCAEQIRAVTERNPVTALLRYQVTRIQAFDANSSTRCILSWLSVVLPWLLFSGLMYYALYRIHFMLAFAWNIVVLYFTLGFRQFSHAFTAIHQALNYDDPQRARDLLREWTSIDTSNMPTDEIVRHTLKHAIIAAHRHVFGVFFWFLVPIGPAGAVLYRVAAYLAQEAPSSLHAMPCNRLAQKIFHLIDWLPVRLTALGFAIAGHFEDALDGWRNGKRAWSQSDANENILLAAGGGALGVHLADPYVESSNIDVLEADTAEPFQSGGVPCTPHTLQSAVGLVWRAVILWMLLLFGITLTVWLSS